MRHLQGRTGRQRLMCQFGHDWCGCCQNELNRLTAGERCPYCNMALEWKGRRNSAVEAIIQKMSPLFGNRGGPMRRKGKFQCQIVECQSSHGLQVLFAHIRDRHPENYVVLGKDMFVKDEWYEVGNIENRSRAIVVNIYALGF